MITLVFTPCGCGHLIVSGLTIIDWNRLTFEPIQVQSIYFDEIEYPISTTFTDKQQLLDYLNTTFVELYMLEGIFLESGDYTNPENFITAEIMAILETNILRIKVGTPINTLNEDTINVANGNVITDSLLEGVEVLQVVIGGNLTEPITSIGWVHDSESGTLTFPIDNYPQDIHVYVLIKQSI